MSSEGSSAAGRVRLTGCGREATYQCTTNSINTICVIQTADANYSDDDDASSDRAASPAKPLKSEVRVENKGDEAVLELELELAPADAFFQP